ANPFERAWKRIEYRIQILLIENKFIEIPLNFFVGKYRDTNVELNGIFKMIDEGTLDAAKQIEYAERVNAQFSNLLSRKPDKNL
ncbi:MAG TPA: hypothetical protein VN426_17750, partial [Syntrophomonadaceae bacterium]|nr:hypothetical protein [Syntrophomonadaceae bacterium]